MPSNLGHPGDDPEVGRQAELDLGIAREFIEMQKEEIAQRRDELVIQRQIQSNAHEYSVAALQVQAKDLNDARQYELRRMRSNLVFAGLVIAALLVFATLALWRDKETIVMEVLKSAAMILGGLGGGYAFGYRRGRQDRAESSVRDGSGEEG